MGLGSIYTNNLIKFDQNSLSVNSSGNQAVATGTLTWKDGEGKQRSCEVTMTLAAGAGIEAAKEEMNKLAPKFAAMADYFQVGVKASKVEIENFQENDPMIKKTYTEEYLKTKYKRYEKLMINQAAKKSEESYIKETQGQKKSLFDRRDMLLRKTASIREERSKWEAAYSDSKERGERLKPEYWENRSKFINFIFDDALKGNKPILQASNKTKESTEKIEPTEKNTSGPEIVNPTSITEPDDEKNPPPKQ